REVVRRERLLQAREAALRAPTVQDAELEEIDDDSALAYERAVVQAELELGDDGTAGDEEDFETIDGAGDASSYAADDVNVVDEAGDQVEEVEDIEAESVASAEDDA